MLDFYQSGNPMQETQQSMIDKMKMKYTLQPVAQNLVSYFQKHNQVNNYAL